MMLFVIVTIAVLIALGLFMGFSAKKEKKGQGLGDPTAGNQPGPR